MGVRRIRHDWTHMRSISNDLWPWNGPTFSSQLPAAAAKSLQSCPTLCDPIDGSPPGSPIPGILQATTLEWVAISFSNALKWKVKVNSLSCVRLFATPWIAAYRAPPPMGFSRQEYWSGLLLPSPMHESENEVAQLCPTLHDPMDCSPPGKSTGVGCHLLLQANSQSSAKGWHVSLANSSHKGAFPQYKRILPTIEGNVHVSLSKELGRWIFKKKGNIGCLQSQKEIYSSWVIYWASFIQAYQWGYLESLTLHQCWELCINLFHTQWK